ncbi:DNA mismatch repair protein MutS [Candidatus Bipolaricaulota bacterium]|nr:DNA mismatch repair protein MutS [Candidatus Bipolaricaulota bacterium]
MMEQYWRLKSQHPTAILFFHLGDFYETFFDDAKTVAAELDVVLTSRSGHPMAGVPVRRGDAYINRLLKKGYKVAICQQVENPKNAKGLVKRQIVRVATPGTVLDEDVLDAGANNYLVAIWSQERHALAALDLSTGEFRCTSDLDQAALSGELHRLSPSEMLVPTTWSPEQRMGLEDLHTSISFVDEDGFDPTAMPSPALELPRSALYAAAAVYNYIVGTQKETAQHLRPLQFYSVADHMDLDPFTVRSMELIHPLRETSKRGTIFGVLDETCTSMGRRLLRRRLLSPLVDVQRITRRLDAVEMFVNSEIPRQRLRDSMKSIKDLERLTGRLGAHQIRPLDVLLIQRTLEQIPEITARISGCGEQPAQYDPSHPASGEALPLPEDLSEAHRRLTDPVIRELGTSLRNMLVDQPPPHVSDGGFIRDGHDAALDALRAAIADTKEKIAAIESRERAETGIGTLKVGYNRVFGYYLEVTRAQLEKVPPRYHRRQTLANAERFTIDDLHLLEQQIEQKQAAAIDREQEIYDAAVERLGRVIPQLQSISDALAELDVTLSLAQIAARDGYVRPEFNANREIRIRDGRHPVVEQVEEFVPNDLEMADDTSLVVLTGPNMAGKSVFLRQAAVICLLAQIGSFVPARKASVPIIDQVFARVGASDALSEGISTFMMEMLEVSAILERATPRSLVILDEMGRGTSTFDGMSIAWAIAHELAVRTQAKTLFATHYHELTQLADELPSVKNLHVAVRELGDHIVFLHHVEPGVAEGSYGVHVARLAGLPPRVTEEADRILDALREGQPIARSGAKPSALEPLPLFGPDDHPILKQLRKIDTDRLSPLEAFNLLVRWKETL